MKEKYSPNARSNSRPVRDGAIVTLSTLCSPSLPSPLRPFPRFSKIFRKPKDVQGIDMVANKSKDKKSQPPPPAKKQIKKTSKQNKKQK